MAPTARLNAAGHQLSPAVAKGGATATRACWPQIKLSTGSSLLMSFVAPLLSHRRQFPEPQLVGAAAAGRATATSACWPPMEMCTGSSSPRRLGHSPLSGRALVMESSRPMPSSQEVLVPHVVNDPTCLPHATLTEVPAQDTILNAEPIAPC